jgi:hypothetical protein
MPKLLIIIVVLVVSASFVVMHADAGILVVDKDRVQCPDAGFTSIQAAVTAANAGDTIQVCPDLYIESVTVTKRLTITAPGSWGDCLQTATPDPTRDAIVQGLGTFGFFAPGGNLVIEGFVIQSTQFAVAWRGSGNVVRDTLLQNNLFGLNAVQTSDSLVQLNCFRDNTLGVAASLVQNLTVAQNTFIRHVNAVQVVNGLTLAVDSNASIDDGLFVFLSRTVAGTSVVGNDVSGAGAGVHLADDNNGVLIAGNSLEGGGFASFSRNSGIVTDLFFNFANPQPQRNIEMRDNEITGFRRSGIEAASNSLLDSVISTNDIRDNALDGVRIEAGTNNSGNVIVGNKLKHNAEHDCHDDTVGSGTAGTANTWENNKGKTENRPDLCAKNN